MSLNNDPAPDQMTAASQNFVRAQPIYRLRMGKNRLAEMPTAERKLLLLLGHATNEIMLFNRMLLTMSTRVSPKPNSSFDYTYAGEAFILLRDLIGKLCEAHTLYKKRFLHDQKIRLKYLDRMSESGQKAERDLANAFSDGVLKKIRNSFSYHYYDEQNKFERAFKIIPDGEIWDIFLADKEGDCFYFISEMVAQYAVLQDVKPVAPDEDPEKWLLSAFAEFSSRATNTSGCVTELFGEIIALLVTSNMDGLLAEPELATDSEAR